MDNIEEVIATMKETLIFLVEQEKIRGEEVKALNEKIDAVNSFMMDNIVNPSIAAFKEEKFNEFNDKYGERLGKFNDTLKLSMDDPNYDATREAFNELDGLSDEEKKDIDEESYVSSVEQGLQEYVDNIKESLGLPTDTAVEIKADEDGNVEVKADEDGDGKPETDVTEEAPKAEAEAPAEDTPKADESEKESKDDEDNELQAALKDYLNK